ncbi:MAG: heme iron utilization protein [Arcobacter sp.]|nr:heme iron utilization protein [Arcobacter sp.]|tara:strand:- start:1658 stop:2167 length:510 start_codon:yes stop_codon:yes gene_type:complete
MGRSIMAKDLNEFLEDFKSLSMSTIDEKGNPFSSYAPFIKIEDKYYVYISLMAKHTTNLKNKNICSLFFVEDESKCSNIFARKRAMVQCNSNVIKQDTKEEIDLLEQFKIKFDDGMITMLKGMKDFHVFEFTPFYGEAVFGFGKAYNLGGKDFSQFVERENTGTKGHGK